MKLIIDIPEEIYKASQTVDVKYEDTIQIPLEVIANGTPIPDNATVGEVFRILTGREPICDTASYFTIDKELWNSPFQKGGKESEENRLYDHVWDMYLDEFEDAD